MLKIKSAYEMIPFLGNIGLGGHDIDKYLLFPQNNHSFTCWSVIIDKIKEHTIEVSKQHTYHLQ
jgi:hypothetical protein